jgi:hypothetical protein
MFPILTPCTKLVLQRRGISFGTRIAPEVRTNKSTGQAINTDIQRLIRDMSEDMKREQHYKAVPSDIHLYNTLNDAEIIRIIKKIITDTRISLFRDVVNNIAHNEFIAYVREKPIVAFMNSIMRFLIQQIIPRIDTDHENTIQLLQSINEKTIVLDHVSSRMASQWMEDLITQFFEPMARSSDNVSHHDIDRVMTLDGVFIVTNEWIERIFDQVVNHRIEPVIHRWFSSHVIFDAIHNHRMKQGLDNIAGTQCSYFMKNIIDRLLHHHMERYEVLRFFDRALIYDDNTVPIQNSMIKNHQVKIGDIIQHKKPNRALNELRNLMQTQQLLSQMYATNPSNDNVNISFEQRITKTRNELGDTELFFTIPEFRTVTRHMEDEYNTIQDRMNQTVKLFSNIRGIQIETAEKYPEYNNDALSLIKKAEFVRNMIDSYVKSWTEFSLEYKILLKNEDRMILQRIGELPSTMSRFHKVVVEKHETKKVTEPIVSKSDDLRAFLKTIVTQVNKVLIRGEDLYRESSRTPFDSMNPPSIPLRSESWFRRVKSRVEKFTKQGERKEDDLLLLEPDSDLFNPNDIITISFDDTADIISGTINDIDEKFREEAIKIQLERVNIIETWIRAIESFKSEYNQLIQSFDISTMKKAIEPFQKDENRTFDTFDVPGMNQIVLQMKSINAQVIKNLEESIDTMVVRWRKTIPNPLGEITKLEIIRNSLKQTNMNFIEHLNDPSIRTLQDSIIRWRQTLEQRVAAMILRLNILNRQYNRTQATLNISISQSNELINRNIDIETSINKLQEQALKKPSIDNVATLNTEITNAMRKLRTINYDIDLTSEVLSEQITGEDHIVIRLTPQNKDIILSKLQDTQFQSINTITKQVKLLLVVLESELNVLSRRTPREIEQLNQLINNTQLVFRRLTVIRAWVDNTSVSSKQTIPKQFERMDRNSDEFRDGILFIISEFSKPFQDQYDSIIHNQKNTFPWSREIFISGDHPLQKRYKIMEELELGNYFTLKFIVSRMIKRNTNVPERLSIPQETIKDLNQLDRLFDDATQKLRALGRLTSLGIQKFEQTINQLRIIYRSNVKKSEILYENNAQLINIDSEIQTFVARTSSRLETLIDNINEKIAENIREEEDRIKRQILNQEIIAEFNQQLKRYKNSFSSILLRISNLNGSSDVGDNAKNIISMINNNNFSQQINIGNQEINKEMSIIYNRLLILGFLTNADDIGSMVWDNQKERGFKNITNLLNNLRRKIGNIESNRDKLLNEISMENTRVQSRVSKMKEQLEDLIKRMTVDQLITLKILIESANQRIQQLRTYMDKKKSELNDVTFELNDQSKVRGFSEKIISFELTSLIKIVDTIQRRFNGFSSLFTISTSYDEHIKTQSPRETLVLLKRILTSDVFLCIRTAVQLLVAADVNNMRIEEIYNHMFKETQNSSFFHKLFTKTIYLMWLKLMCDRKIHKWKGYIPFHNVRSLEMESFSLTLEIRYSLLYYDVLSHLTESEIKRHIIDHTLPGNPPYNIMAKSHISDPYHDW